MITPAASGDQLSDADRGPIIDTHLHAFAFAGDVPGPRTPRGGPRRGRCRVRREPRLRRHASLTRRAGGDAQAAAWRRTDLGRAHRRRPPRTDTGRDDTVGHPRCSTKASRCLTRSPTSTTTRGWTTRASTPTGNWRQIFTGRVYCECAGDTHPLPPATVLPSPSCCQGYLHRQGSAAERQITAVRGW